MKARWKAAAIAAVLLWPLLSPAQSTGAREREYPFSVTAVDAGLKQLGAYTGARLPSLDGFITTERDHLPTYQRPYYEFKIDLDTKSPTSTVVHVRAHISAWYEDPTGQHSGYQDLQSNGHLETDLLDRLNDYLQNNRGRLLADPTALQKQLADVQQQEQEAEQRIAGLENRLRGAESARSQVDPEFASVSGGHVSVFKEPDERSSVLLRAEAEDEFQVLEHRGSWIRVSLQDSHSGWIRDSEARVVSASSAIHDQADPGLAGFIIVRRSVVPFSGDWGRLKGKTAAYLWARPIGSALNASPAGRLQFAEAAFRDRYEEFAHSPTRNVDGVVIIFLDEGGGVAAANLEDVGLWVEGAISRAEFFKRCSLDPPPQFLEAHPRELRNPSK
jgi:hypothetical protein